MAFQVMRLPSSHALPVLHKMYHHLLKQTAPAGLDWQEYHTDSAIASNIASINAAPRSLLEDLSYI